MGTKIRMRTTYAGPAGTARGGGIIELEDEEAQALIAAGYAEQVVAGAPPDEPGEEGESGGVAASGGPDETATVEQPETTAARTRRPTPRRIGTRRPAAPEE